MYLKLRNTLSNNNLVKAVMVTGSWFVENSAVVYGGYPGPLTLRLTCHICKAYPVPDNSVYEWNVFPKLQREIWMMLHTRALITRYCVRRAYLSTICAP